ncbi:MAG: ANTAR domain-containing protein [Candidatus Acidiferrales bacterium]
MENIHATNSLEVDLLHDIGSRMAAAEPDPLHEDLGRVLDCAVALVKCDSCFVYVLEGDELVLRASKNPHSDVVDSLKLSLGQGITGWVAEHRTAVAVSKNASADPRFQFFKQLPEDTFQAILCVPILCRGKVTGVINVQHIQPHVYKQREIRLLSTVGFLVGAEIELARLESANEELSERLETRKFTERAKGILQRELGISEEKAYLALNNQARQMRKTMREVAEAIILSDEVKRSSRGAGAC